MGRNGSNIFHNLWFILGKVRDNDFLRVFYTFRDNPHRNRMFNSQASGRE